MNESEYLKKALEDKYIEIDSVKNCISYNTREGMKTYPSNKSEELGRKGWKHHFVTCGDGTE